MKHKKLPRIDSLYPKVLKTQVEGVTFLSFIKEKGENFLYIHIKNERGGVDKIKFKSDIEEKDMKWRDWQYVIEVLNSKEYVKEGEGV